MNVNDIKVSPPFSDLFPINPEVLKRVADNMWRKGFDMSQPIILWKGKDIIVDGHTRYYAAIKAGIQEVHTFLKDFNDEDAALHYAITQQANRRNLTDAEIIRCIEALDQRRKQGEDQERAGGKFQPKAQSCAIGKTCQDTAQTIGISPREVEQARTVLDHADPETR